MAVAAIRAAAAVAPTAAAAAIREMAHRDVMAMVDLPVVAARVLAALAADYEGLGY